MKKDIHPQYFKAKVRCACGHEFTVGSTQEEIRVDVCSQCHPFYTGKENLIDSEGRVVKFQKKLEKAKAMQGEKKKKDSKKKGGDKNDLKDLREIAQDA